MTACIDAQSWLAHQEKVDVLAAKLLGARRIGIVEDSPDERAALRAAQTMRSQEWMIGVSGMVCR
jgi:hypothetical protein